MAAAIDIAHTAGDDYVVQVRDDDGSTSEHTVKVTDAHLDTYAPESTKKELLAESFRFLLEREPKESILGSFDLQVIQRYFPEYPEKIGERVGGS